MMWEIRFVLKLPILDIIWYMCLLESEDISCVCIYVELWEEEDTRKKQ